MEKSFRSKILMLLLIFVSVFTITGVFSKLYSNKASATVISNRTINDTWNFQLDDADYTLTIRLKQGQTSGGLMDSRFDDLDDSVAINYWKSIWKKSPTDPTDLRPLVKHVKFITNNVGAKFDFNGQIPAFMFYGFSKLEDIDFSGVVKDSQVSIAIRGMFMGCSSLKSVDLSWMATKANSLRDMKDLFNGCTSLQKVILNNPNFITRTSTMDSNGNVTSGAAQLNRMFQDCTSLKEIDMSNITLYGRDSDWTKLNTGVFTSDLTALQTIKIDNIKLPNFKNLDNVFSGLSALTNFSMTSKAPGDIAPQVLTMKNMFKDSFTSPVATETATLNVSGLGKLENIQNMDGFIEGCSGLQVINFDNLDNSTISPTNTKHSITSGQSGYVTRAVAQQIGAKEFGREIFGKYDKTNNPTAYDIPSNFPKLTTVSAQNSNIWLCKNSSGLPGNEYYNASDESSILYLANRKMTLNGVAIDYQRDWIDIITDRDSTNFPSLSGASDIADRNTNINIAKNLNTLSAGHLAPGVYEISTTPFATIKIDDPSSYYAIHYMGTVRPTVELLDSHGGDIILTAGSENLHYITTKNMTKAEWGTATKTIPFKAVITYPDAAIDVNGKKHDVIITINSVTFTDLNRIPSYSSYNGQRTHDSNNYWDSLKADRDSGTTKEYSFYRTILQATKADGLIFDNYTRVGDPKSPWQYTSILSGGAGTTIDFDVKIDKANPDTTFVLHAGDLDIAAFQDWVKPNNDADYDNLPIKSSTYGLGGESIELVSGADINDVKFAAKTGLTISGSKVISTGSDPSTTWSDFKVASKADGNGSSYRWITGVSCSSFMLLNTNPTSLSGIEFEPIKKVLDGDVLRNGQFNFTLTPDTTVANNKATGSTITKTNDANGNVDFGFSFNNPQVTIDGLNYYPGTNDNSTQSQNTRGNGTHNSYVYAWTVSEIDGGDSSIDYDLGPKKLKIIVSTPENDAEVLKGIKAEIYVDGTLVDTVWSKDVKTNKHTGSVIFTNTVMKEVTLKVNWLDDDNTSGSRPDDLEGFITYQTTSSTGQTQIVTTPGTWTKNGNTWELSFRIPKSATVLKWGEITVPNNYQLLSVEQTGANVYELTNAIKKEPPITTVSTPGLPTVPQTGFSTTQTISLATGSILIVSVVALSAVYLVKRKF